MKINNQVLVVLASRGFIPAILIDKWMARTLYTDPYEKARKNCLQQKIFRLLAMVFWTAFLTLSILCISVDLTKSGVTYALIILLFISLGLSVLALLPTDPESQFGDDLGELCNVLDLPLHEVLSLEHEKCQSMALGLLSFWSRIHQELITQKREREAKEQFEKIKRGYQIFYRFGLVHRGLNAYIEHMDKTSDAQAVPA